MSASIFVRLDAELKKDATEILNQLGLDVSTAVKIFLHQVVNNKGLPFEVSLVSNQKDDLSGLKQTKMYVNKKEYKAFFNLLKSSKEPNDELLRLMKEAEELKLKGI